MIAVTTHYQFGLSSPIFSLRMEEAVGKIGCRTKSSKKSWKIPSAGVLLQSVQLHDTLRYTLLLSFQLCIKAISIHKMHCMIFKDNKLSQPCYRSHPKEGVCSKKHHLTTSYVLPSGPLRSSLMNCQHQVWQHIHFLFRGWPKITLLSLQDLPVFRLKQFSWRHDNSVTAIWFS